MQIRNIGLTTIEGSKGKREEEIYKERKRAVKYKRKCQKLSWAEQFSASKFSIGECNGRIVSCVRIR